MARKVVRMAKRSPQTAGKREREQAKRERRERKEAKKAARHAPVSEASDDIQASDPQPTE
jgi:hypothetical protein